jgi:hypothetical protein
MRRYTVELLRKYPQADEPLCINMAEFESESEAIAYAKRIINGSLEQLRRPELTPVRLFAAWAARGDRVRIRGRHPVAFRSNDYARDRAYCGT